MARGQQKIQSQQKNAERQAKLKKAQSSKRAENKALVYSCTVCKVSVCDSFVALWHVLCGQWSKISIVQKYQLVKGYLQKNDNF